MLYHIDCIYAGSSPPVGNRERLRHFPILAGLESADQSELSRLTVCLASAMSDITFSIDSFALLASVSLREPVSIHMPSVAVSPPVLSEATRIWLSSVVTSVGC